MLKAAMRQYMKDQDRDPAPDDSVRKAYSAPRLRCFGDIRQLTQTPITDNLTGVDMAVGNQKS